MSRDAVMRIMLQARDSASGVLGRFKGSLGGVGRGLSALGGPLALVAAGVGAIGAAAAAAANKLISLSKEQAALGDEAAKGAKRLSLLTEEFTALQFAADRSGASKKAVATSMRKLAAAAVEARDGVATYKDVFDELGISVTTNDGRMKDMKDLFLETVDALNKQENATLRLGLGQKVLGRGMIDLAVLIDEGKEGITALIKESDRYGATISTKFAKSSEDFVDSQTNMDASINATKRALVEGFLPDLTIAMNAMAEALQDPTMLAVLQALGKFAGTTTRIIFETGGRIGDLIDFAKTPRGAMLLPLLLPGGLGAILQGQVGAGAGLAGSRPKPQFPGGQGASQGDTIGQGQGPMEGPGGAGALKAERDRLLALGAGLSSEGLGGDESAWERRVEQFREIQAMMEALGPPVTEQIEVWANYEERLAAVGEAFNKNIAVAGLGALGQLTAGFGTSVGRMIVYGEKLGSNLKAIFKNVISNLIGQLVSLFVQLIATSILMAFIGLGNPAAAANVMQMLGQAGITLPGVGGGGGGSGANRSGANSAVFDAARTAPARTVNFNVQAFQVPGSADQQRELADIVLMRGREMGYI